MNKYLNYFLILFLGIAFFPFSAGALDIISSNSITMSAKVLSSSPAVNLVSGSHGGSYLQQKGGVLIFRGYAYPDALITLTKNGQAVANTFADKNAFFELSLARPDIGNFYFILGAKDAATGDLSISYKFNINIEKDSNIVVSGIVFPPTIYTDRSEITRGYVLKFFGRTVPGGKVILKIEPYLRQHSVTADKLGNWIFYYNTASISRGVYQARIKAEFNKLLSEYGRPTLFKIGEKTVSSSETPPGEKENETSPVIEIPLFPEVPVTEAPGEALPVENRLIVKYSLLYLLLLLFIPVLLFCWKGKSKPIEQHTKWD